MCQIGARYYRLFDPRRDRWKEHFVFLHNYLFVAGISAIGRATETALHVNDSRLNGPLGTRHDAILLKRYPPNWAEAWVPPADVGSES